jgi:hypothetical protein
VTIKTQLDVLPSIQIESQPHAALDVPKLYQKGLGVKVIKHAILGQLELVQEADLDGAPFSRWIKAIQDCAELSEANVRILGFSPEMYFGHWLKQGSGRSIPPRAMRMSLLLALAQGAFRGFRKREAPDHLRRWAEIQLPEDVNRDSALPNEVSHILFGSPGHTYADLFVNLYPFNDQIGFGQFLWRCFRSEAITHDDADRVMDVLMEHGVTCPTFVKLPPIPSGMVSSIGLFTKLDNLSGMPRRIGQLLVNKKLRMPAQLMRLDGPLTECNGFGQTTVNQLRAVLSESGYRVSDFPCLR